MKSDNKTCGICFDNILSTGKINSCEHDFHYKCIVRWSKISSNCPTCRIAFTEICHIKCGKLLKKIHINEDSHTTEEDISNSDIEEWQAVCGICLSTSPEFLLVCEGGSGCSNVVHSYCLPPNSSPDHWLCDDCEGEASESLASEESSQVDASSDQVSDLDSNPDADFDPKPESPPRRVSIRLTTRSGQQLYELRSESENSFIESDSDDFSDDRSYTEEVVEPTRRSARVARRRYQVPESDSEGNSEEYAVVTRRREKMQRIKGEKGEQGEKGEKNSNSSRGNDRGRAKDSETEDLRAGIREKENDEDRNICRVSATQGKALRRLKRNNEQNETLVQIPCKRTRMADAGGKDNLLEFLTSEAQRELERVKDSRFNSGRMIRILVGMISRNERLHNIDDTRTVQKIRTVIRNHIAGMI